MRHRFLTTLALAAAGIVIGACQQEPASQGSGATGPAGPAGQAGPASPTGPVVTTDPAVLAHWCRTDDPGPVEAERARQELAASDIAKVACAEAQPAAELPEEVQLPLPCGAKLVMRRVDVPSRHILDQQQIFLGSPTPSTTDAGSVRTAALAGPWTDVLSGSLGPVDEGYAYYIARYETTEPVFGLWQDGLFALPADETKSITAPACAPYRDRLSRIDGTQVLPARAMSHAEAIAFASAASDWLARNRDRLEGIPGGAAAGAYLRLPTEAEWEYAARGGLATRVNQTEVASGWETPVSDVSEIGFFVTPQTNPAPDTDVFYVGRRPANRLGLYDMLGNVSEFVLEPFRPVRPDGLSGRIGGVVLRGGSSVDDPARVSSGSRTEVPAFDSDGAYRSGVSGFRLVLSAPFFVNAADGAGREMIGNTGLDNQLVAAVAEISGAGGDEDLIEQQRALQQVIALQGAGGGAGGGTGGGTGAAAGASPGASTGTRAGAGTAPAGAGLTGPAFIAMRAELAAVRTSLERAIALASDRDRRLRRETWLSALTIGQAVSLYDILARQNRIDIDLALAEATPQERQSAEFQSLLAQVRADEVELFSFRDASFNQYAEIILRMSRVGVPELTRIDAEVARSLPPAGARRFTRLRQMALRHATEAANAGGAVAPAVLTRWRQELIRGG